MAIVQDKAHTKDVLQDETVYTDKYSPLQKMIGLSGPFSFLFFSLSVQHTRRDI